jgi:hypothetical protein
MGSPGQTASFTQEPSGRSDPETQPFAIAGEHVAEHRHDQPRERVPRNRSIGCSSIPFGATPVCPCISSRSGWSPIRMRRSASRAVGESVESRSRRYGVLVEHSYRPHVVDVDTGVIRAMNTMEIMTTTRPMLSHDLVWAAPSASSNLCSSRLAGIGSLVCRRM